VTPLEHVLDALRAHGCDPKRNGSGWGAKCPAHDDRVASLTASEGANGYALLNCHAGDGCSFTEIASALDLPKSAFFPPKKDGPSMNIVETYPYVDERGNLLFEVVRLDPKDFRQRHPVGNGWEWNLHGVRRVLYRLPRVREAALVHGTVYIVEGEKDVEAAERADPDIVATCCPMGAKKWRKYYNDMLRSVGKVVVVADATTTATNTPARSSRASTATSTRSSTWKPPRARTWPTT
jgi:putative DNA primase/helicase